MSNTINTYTPKFVSFSIAGLFLWIGKELVLKSNNSINSIIGYIFLALGGIFLVILFFKFYTLDSEKIIADKYKGMISEYEGIIDNMKKGFNFTSTIQRNELNRTSTSGTNSITPYTIEEPEITETN